MTTASTRRRHGVSAPGAPTTTAGPAVHAFADTESFATGMARVLGVRVQPIITHRFPDGETLVRVAPAGAADAVVVRSLHDPNPKLLETVLAADALRRVGARRVVLVAPYLPYMRQDRVFRAGEALSQRVVGAWLGASFDAVLTVEAHLHRVPRLDAVIPGVAHSLSAAPVIAEWLRTDATASLVVGPDVESAPWVRAVAAAADAAWVVARKQRRRDHAVHVELPGRTPCPRRAVIVDDIASSGATLAATARALHDHGIQVIDAVVVHAIFARGALARIRAAGIRRLVSCDTVPHRSNRLGCAGLMAAAVAAVLR